MTIRPGIIAFLYKIRWNIEKTFDVFKNKSKETKAWASSPTAKTIQDQFLCCLHNLLALLEDKLKKENIQNEAELRRKTKESAKDSERAAKANRIIPAAVQAWNRFSQQSSKLIRWLMSSLLDRLPWHLATIRLRALYAVL